MRFENKVVLITGAASGIGKAAAETFAKEGAKIVLSDYNTKLGEMTTAEIIKQGGQAIFVSADVSKYEDVKALVDKAVEEYGCIDIALNNAGIGGPLAPTSEVKPSDWDRVIAVNQTGVYYCMKEELRVMGEQRKGCIVNISSIAGVRGLPNQIAYVASKHAVAGMTKTAALEYARYGIRVNAVCPVFTHTPLVEQLLSMRSDLEEKLLKTIPLRRFGEVEDIVNAITWLSADASSFITGMIMKVDGGQTV